jgi:succinoglycan biosynthesis transport protein ExoP
MTKEPDRSRDLPRNRSLAVRSRGRQTPSRSQRFTRDADAGADDSQGGITPYFLWCVFARWWNVVIPASLVLGILACGAVLYLHVLKYRATAILMIEGSTPFIAFNAGTNAGAQNQFVQTQIELLRSPIVLEPTLAHPEVGGLAEFQGKKEPVEHMKSQLTVKQISRSELYELSYVSPSREGAAAVVNAILTEYEIVRGKEDSRRSDRVIELLERQSAVRKIAVGKLRNEVIELAKKVTGKDPFSQNIMSDPVKASNPASALFQELTSIEVDRELLKAELQTIDESPDEPVTEALVSDDVGAEIDAMPQVRQLAKQIELVRSEMESVKKLAVAGEEHPEFVRRQEFVASLEKELKDLRSILVKQVRRNQSPMGGLTREDRASQIRRELAKLDARHQLLTKKYQTHVENMQAGGAETVNLEFKKAELQREEQVFELIAARTLALKTESEAPERVRQLQKARPPMQAIEPVPYKLMILAGGMAMALPFGLLVIRESVGRKLTTIFELGRESRLPVLGEIVRFPMRPVAGRTHALPRRLQREMYLFAESVESLRTSLALAGHLGTPERPQILAVASAASGEGKTSIATSLAMSIATAGKTPVLVIDADLRSPEVAKVLGTPNHPGLAELLAGKCTVEEAVHRAPNSNLYVIPAGVAKMSPHRLIQGAALEKLLQHLKAKFPMIVIDTPPVLAASESLICARIADSVVYCTLRDVTRVKQMQSALEKLEHANAHIAGAVLSGVASGRYSYDYGNYMQQIGDS